MSGNLSVYSPNVPSPHPYTPFTPDHNTSDSSEIQCICGFHHDDGFTIACDQCDTWQHVYCVDIDKDAVPEKYECPSCRPRPVDVRRAQDYQERKVDDRGREEKPRRKKTKSTSSSNPSRKKDSSSNAMQSSGPGLSVLTDRAGASGKTNSSKESTSSRKRGSNRGSVSTKSEPNTNYVVDPVNGAFGTPVGAATSNASSPAMTVTTDRNFEGESDTDMEKPQPYRYDFTDITNSKDHYASKEVQHFVNQLIIPPHDETVRWLNSHDVASVHPGLSVISLPGNSHTYSPAQHFITVDNQCQDGQLVALCKGEINFKESYRSNAINQFNLLRHPKPCVFFHPSQPVCIDSRIHGSLARFVRRSCRPNTALATVIIDGAEVAFGLFATETVPAESTMTIGWEWGYCRSIQKIVNGTPAEQLDDGDFQDAISFASTLAREIGECACVDKDECVFFKLNQCEAEVKRELSPPKLLTRTRRGSRATQSTPGSNKASPERHVSSDREDSSRSSKSLSRDLSPQTDGRMSGRDARKLQGLLSRFEKIEQGDQLAGNKRRKRNNTVCASTAITPESILKAEVVRKSKGSSTAISPLSSLRDGCDVVAPDLPLRKSPNSLSITSDELRIQMQPPPAPIKRIKKPDYVDCAMQTDECNDAWWCASTPDTSPAPIRISMKERLMQSMLREREEAATLLESRKRKQSEISDSCPSPPGKELGQESYANSVPYKSNQNTTDIPMEDGPRELVNTPEPSDETPMTSVSPSDVGPVEPVFLSQPRGPAFANTFADSSPTKVPLQEQLVDDKRTPPVSPKSTTMDFTRSPSIAAGRPFGLQVQLPAGPAFPTAPATPSPMPPLTSSPPPATPGAHAQSPSSLSATNSNFPVSALSAISSQGFQMNSTSTPKTKKLSLSEYGRRKKVDHNDKKAMISAVSEEVSISLNKGGANVASLTTST
ncbi:hypothetical protein L211DRAFT_847791 [Terfezia boudieri ATCC MYA-4762]|uniref:Zinc finger PHD-type domain-containing protein n=1 Tax=Terfezia boudieri ATCC MYA-4762 TaxID=1051890 RepID=A0A3N4LY10_9PEZI|nr:hypothetical protein L211DRAFT_847791 [Terfezia boudieri ATCC MYA-4762]